LNLQPKKLNLGKKILDHPAGQRAGFLQKTQFFNRKARREKIKS